MADKTVRYTPEFRRQMVALARSGRTAASRCRRRTKRRILQRAVWRTVRRGYRRGRRMGGHGMPPVDCAPRAACARHEPRVSYTSGACGTPPRCQMGFQG